MWWVASALAEGPTSPAPDPSAGRVPEVRWYGRVDTTEQGRLAGRYRRRRDGEALTELPDGRVVRWREVGRGFVLDHLRDADGRAWATVRYEKDLPVQVLTHAVPDIPVDVAGWTAQPLPGGGAVWSPSGAATAGGVFSVEALGGAFSARAAAATDPFAPAFREGLLAGCAGCRLTDQGPAWIDDRPAAHYALAVPDGAGLPGEGVPDAAEIWAVPRADAQGVAVDTLLLVFRGHAPPDPVAFAVSARVFPALVDLDAAPPAGASP